MTKSISTTLIAALALVIGYGAGHMNAKTSRVYELRTYTAAPGKLEALHARFRNHTLKLFEKHGMKNIAYWAPSDDPLKSNTLIYVVAHESREAAKKSWDAFRVDPDWIKARDASEVNGKLTAKVESVYMEATDYSPMK